jgi:hypothetical protein
MDAETLKLWKDTDREHQLLQKAKRDSGIEGILRRAGRKYFALSPRLDKDGTIVYWLNPYDDDKAKPGWYSLQELKDWAEGRGRVVRPDPPPPEPEPEPFQEMLGEEPECEDGVQI